MPRSNWVQDDFRGGEWGPASQGKFDDPRYRIAMGKSFNGLPTEEGSWTRRAGTQRIIPTYRRAMAKLLLFESSTSCAFACEFTPGNLQFYSGTAPIFTNDAQVVTAASYASGAITFTTTSAHGWAVNDTFMLSFPSGYNQSLEFNCRGRVFQAIAGTTGSTLVVADDTGVPLTLTNFPTGGLVGATVLRIKRFSTVYTGVDIADLRLVQSQVNGVILSAGHPPYELSVTEPAAGADPVFALSLISFVDGPYLDPTGDTATVSGYTGSITVTPVNTTPASTDVGRHIRLFSQPPVWAAGTAYTTGQFVTDSNGAWWQAIAGSTGVNPGSLTTSGGVSTVVWAPAPTAGQWAWGKITAQSSTTWTVTLEKPLNSANGSTVTSYRLGLFMAGQYPTVGLYHEGRLMLMGAVPNRFDLSVSNDPFNFAPTDANGNVNDDNAIDYTLNSKKLNTVQWLEPDQAGVIIGTDGGEWLLSTGSTSDTFTPTSIEARQVTSYGSRFVEPRRIGPALVFAQRYGRRPMEYLADAFSGRFSGRHLNGDSKHLTEVGITELAYQQESVPVVWARTADGRLVGCTYRRESRFATEKPVFEGSHEHQHGATGARFESMCVVPREDGVSDWLYLSVNVAGKRYVEVMRPFPEATDGIMAGWFVDSGAANAVPTTLQKCGNLFPSYGYSGSGSIAATTWPAPAGVDPNIDADRATDAPGTTVPDSGPIIGIAKDAVYFNAFSQVSGLGLQKTQKLSLSCWIYTDGDQGLLLGTPVSFAPDPASSHLVTFLTWWRGWIGTNDGTGWKNYFLTGLFMSQMVGMQDLKRVIYGLGDTPVINQSTGLLVNNGQYATGYGTSQAKDFPLVGGARGWQHLMVSWDWLTGQSIVYVNDTAVYSASTGNPFNTAGGKVRSDAGYGPWITANSVDLSSLIVGGVPYLTVDSDGPFIDAPNNDFGYNLTYNYSPGAPAGNGLRAAMAELWIDTGRYVDWSSATNRQKFHNTNLAGTRFTPCDIGNKGQLPFSANPKIYMTGAPPNFRVNRVTGNYVATYNGASSIIDPKATQLDPSPYGVPGG